MNPNIIKFLSKNFYAISLYTRQITGSLVLFILARYLTVYDYGLFSSYKNIAAFCLMFANMGFAGYILISSKANIRKVQQKIALFLINAILLLFIIMAYIPLLILSLSNLGLAAANVYGEYLTTSGNQKYKIPIQIMAIFISIVSLFIFIKLGIIGSSLACLTSVWFVAIMYTKKAFKIIKEQERMC